MAPCGDAAASVAPTLAYEDGTAAEAPTLTYDTQPFFGCPDFGHSGASGPTLGIERSTAAAGQLPATLAYDDGAFNTRTAVQFPDTLAYDADALAPLAAGQFPATQAYDEHALFGGHASPVRGTANSGASWALAAAPQPEDVAPTLDYGEDTIRPNVNAASPPRAEVATNAAPRAETATVAAARALASAAGGTRAGLPGGVAADLSPVRSGEVRSQEQRKPADATLQDTSIFADERSPQKATRRVTPSPTAPAPEAGGTKRRRLRGKQAVPPAFLLASSTPASRATAPPPRPTPAQMAPSSRAAPAATVATPRSPRPSRGMPTAGAGTTPAGTQVLVRGDGWGGGGGEYLATVMDTDAFTHTVIRQFPDGRVEETIVQREYCDAVCGPEGQPETTRARPSR